MWRRGFASARGQGKFGLQKPWFCWQVMRLHRIEICIRPENGRSLRVVEKLGFREEGMRPRFLHINGDWRDHRVFALNAEEVPDGLLNRYLADRG